MMTSLSNGSEEPATALEPQRAAPVKRASSHSVAAPTVATFQPLPTVFSRVIVFLICATLAWTTVAFGAVHYQALIFVQATAALIVILWLADAWRTGALRVSRNPLQLALIGWIVIGLIQLLPFGSSGAGDALTDAMATNALSLDPMATRIVIIQAATLLVFFAATLAFTDTLKRAQLLVRTLMLIGFLAALYGIVQNLTDPLSIYGIKKISQSTAFAAFINRHHFASFMLMALAVPLAGLFNRTVAAERRPVYIFVCVVMGVALILTQSRGGLLSLVALIAFIVLTATGDGERKRRRSRADANEDEPPRAGQRALVRAGLGLGLIIVLALGVVFIGGESAFNRLLGTVNSDDPTSGRAHFWQIALTVFREHPFVGAGLGAFGNAYTQYDTRNGALRVEQVHNDYLQVLSDAGIIGALLGAFFVFMLLKQGFAQRAATSGARRGIAVGALAGCFAVLVHSFFDFPLHTTTDALAFLTLAALATGARNFSGDEADGNAVERHSPRRRRSSGESDDSRRRSSRRHRQA